MASSTSPPIILVDGSSYLFRAYHALPPLTNSQREPTGAMYGVLNMLRKLVNDYQPEYIGVVFDFPGRTFRHTLYPEYKANRAVMPDELRVQIQPLHEMIRALGLPLVVVEGVEADDVIATLAAQAAKKRQTMLISTVDKDLAQLVNEHVTLINTMSGQLLDAPGVREKFGVTPAQIVDYLTLIGDPVDNVPGIPKVGPKTAAKWIAQYKSLDNIVAHAEEIGGKVGENLRAHVGDLPLARQLITVKSDVKLPLALHELKCQTPDKKTLVELFSHYEFKQWLVEFTDQDTARGGEGTSKQEKRQYDLVLDKKNLADWIKRLKKASSFAFDTETTHLNARRAELVGLSFSVTPGQAAYVPVAHHYLGAPAQLDREYVLGQIAPLLNEANKPIIGQNLKYDIQILRRYGVGITAPIYDTLLESYVLNNVNSRHNLDSMALKYLGVNTIQYTDVAGRGAKQVTFDKVAVKEACEYAAEDADIALQLHHQLWPRIKKIADHRTVLETVEWPLIRVLANMEYIGVLIDEKRLALQSQQLAKQLRQLEAQAFTLAGKTFNLNSPKQLQVVLYEDLQLPVLKKTTTGQASTAESVLATLAHNYELPKVILDYRSFSKLKSTYTDALPLQINPDTGRVHTSYNQAVTSTGRLSSTDPNLQNIPARREEGRKIRQAFIAPPGYQIISADYSQVELRIMAHLSKDPGLLAAFSNGLDIHRATAAEVFGVPIDKVNATQRRHAKTINFGLIYGMSAFGLSQQLGMERKLAQEYIDIYFKRYPKVHEYMDRARKLAAKQGYVETMLGRRIYVPDIKSSNVQRRHAAERAAINAPLQGTAADIIKLAMIHIHDWIERETKGQFDEIKMIMQVHDELVFEVKRSKVTSAKKHIKQLMENAVALSNPLLVAIGVGDNWDQAH